MNGADNSALDCSFHKIPWNNSIMVHCILTTLTFKCDTKAIVYNVECVF